MAEFGGERNIKSCFYRAPLASNTRDRRDMIAVRHMIRDSLLQRNQNLVCTNLTLCLVKVRPHVTAIILTCISLPLYAKEAPRSRCCPAWPISARRLSRWKQSALTYNLQTPPYNHIFLGEYLERTMN